MVDINHIEGTVTIQGKLSEEENILVAKMRSAGYEVKKKRAKTKGGVQKLSYYQQHLDAEQWEKFEKLKKDDGFFTAAHWADEQLKK